MPRFLFIVILLTALPSHAAEAPAWGFFGHRRINRLATFTLPMEMFGFFKKNIEYITQHAVDPDKRRYATKHEAVRHYIDIDHWGTYPFPEVPRDWTDALAKYTEIQLINSAGDTLALTGHDRMELEEGIWFFTAGPLHERSLTIAEENYRSFFREQVLPQYYEDEWTLSCDSLATIFGIAADDWNCQTARAVDHFSEYGILPYHLLRAQRQLTRAFLDGDPERILRLCADFGHYIADAHVPLHTTENYNGQLSGQDGIHAFWESRIPELFADAQYDFFVGQAEYIRDPKSYYWDVVLSSHELVDSVLIIERELRETFPENEQYCFDERLGRTVRTQCEAFAAAYQARLNGSIERRMREAILAVGSAWYTAWVDAGSPPLHFTEVEASEIAEEPPAAGAPKGRVHEN